MPNNHELRREYVLDHAVAAGKFSASRRAHWSAQYDRDPAGTEQVLAALAGGLASGIQGTAPYPRELFPELSRPRSLRQRIATRAAAPPPPAAQAPRPSDNLDTQVAAWSRELFPELSRAAAGTGSRITRAHD